MIGRVKPAEAGPIDLHVFHHYIVRYENKIDGPAVHAASVTVKGSPRLFRGRHLQRRASRKAVHIANPQAGLLFHRDGNVVDRPAPKGSVKITCPYKRKRLFFMMPSDLLPDDCSAVKPRFRTGMVQMRIIEAEPLGAAVRQRRLQLTPRADPRVSGVPAFASRLLRRFRQPECAGFAPAPAHFAVKDRAAFVPAAAVSCLTDAGVALQRSFQIGPHRGEQLLNADKVRLIRSKPFEHPLPPQRPHIPAVKPYISSQVKAGHLQL